MTDMLNRLSVFSEWTLRLDRLDSFGETSIVMAMFVFLAIAVVYFYAAVKREIPKRHRVFLLVCRLLTVLTLFVICMQPKIIQWHDQSRVVMLCDTSKSMSITGNESQGDETAVSKTRLQRIRDFSGVATGDHESVPNSAIVHELICNTIGESLGNAIAIAPGEDWQSRLRDWLSELRAEGKESRLSEQLCDVIAREKNHSLAGVVLMTDGCNNIGMGNETLLKRLKTCPCPVHVVAVGKQAPAFEFGIKILRAPSRNRLQSEIPVSLELGSLGELDEKGHGTECAVDLYMIAQDTSSQDVGSEVPVIEPGTKPVATLSFHMSNTGRLFASPSEALSASTGNRQSEPRESLLKIQTHVKATSCGRFVLVAQLRHPRQAVTHEGKSFMPIEVFEKKDKILLIAGGPLRDFQFFESRLKRSSDVSTDVYLSFAKRFYHLDPVSGSVTRVAETAPAIPAASDISAALSSGKNNAASERFTARSLSEYDALVAFDPDWNAGFTSDELDAVEEWVSRQAGGLIVTAGPVFAGQQIDGWTQSMKTKVVRSLYPVRFFAEGSQVESGFSTVLPRRVRMRVHDAFDSGPFAQPGQDASFDWSAFPGFYGALPVEAVKPAATLWATLEDPSQPTQTNTGLAVLFASQRYGAGRVFYIGNSELWRLRMVNESLPESVFSNLIQYVTEGRREKMSPFGRLTVDRDICQPGATVVIQAVLNDIHAKPLVLENAMVEVMSPQGKKSEMKLMARKDMLGVYDGRVIATECGRWKLSCPVPGTSENLQTTFLVREDDLESWPSYRNDQFLREITTVTGGRYMNADAERHSGDLASLLESLPAFERVASEDRNMEQILRAILLSILCSLFLIEWLSRRMMGLV